MAGVDPFKKEKKDKMKRFIVTPFTLIHFNLNVDNVFFLGAQFFNFPKSRLKVETGHSQSSMVWSQVLTNYLENISTFKLNRLD